MRYLISQKCFHVAVVTRCVSPSLHKHTDKPVVPSDRITISITQGERLELNCAAVGNPQPSYSWTTPQPVSPLWKDSVFVIESVTTEQGGEYTCTVRNSVGYSTVTYDVEVKGEFQLLFLLFFLLVLRFNKNYNAAFSAAFFKNRSTLSVLVFVTLV